MKTTIKSTSNSAVTIKFADLTNDAAYEHEISAPRDGGYVRFSDGKQVCERLSTTGSTLYWNGTFPLIDLVRREYSAMRRAEKRELARYL